jgi:hypothetical protein
MSGHSPQSAKVNPGLDRKREILTASVAGNSAYPGNFILA